MKKIAIITPFLANGGLEKVAVTAAQELNKYYDITLIVMDSFQIDYAYEGNKIDLKVSLMNRGNFKRLFNVIKSIIKLRKIKKQYKFDSVISHGELANIPNVFSGGTKNILTIHGNRVAFKTDLQGKFVTKIIKYIYSIKNVSKIITVSEGIRESFIDKLGLNPSKIKTIYNPYDIKEIKQLAIEKLSKYSVIYNNDVLTITGRLTMQKGQWFLLRIFDQLKKIKPNLKLIILGDGDIKQKLVKVSSELNLETYSVWSDNAFHGNYDVYFLGFVSNPFKYIARSKLFIMTSLWEGFGNTIVEAMACGIPVISTACKSGPSEIINPPLERAHEIKEPNFKGNGVLMPIFENKFIDANVAIAPNEELWVNTVNKLLTDDNLLKQYTQKGLLRANDFEVEPIVDEWKKVIDIALS